MISIKNFKASLKFLRSIYSRESRNKIYYYKIWLGHNSNKVVNVNPKIF